MEKRPIKVLVVDDSKVSRDLLQNILESDPDIEVVGYAVNGEEALHWLKNHEVDVITMDILMPGMNGLEVTRRIMETHPTPIVIVSSAYQPKNAEQGFQAMEVGALAILEKPRRSNDELYKLQTKEILDTIKTVAEVKLVKRWQIKKKEIIVSEPEELIENIEAIAIGASLGGPVAIAKLLAGLPATFPVPIFIVQHIASGFTSGFSSWLQSQSPLHITLAMEGERPRPGHCYIAPDACHLEITKNRMIKLNRSTKDLLQPSVARLFQSVADAYGPQAVGVILTGMGTDGAPELKLMRQQGAYTIAQDEKSSIMFGMPREAIKLGGVARILPLDAIPQALINLVRQKGGICLNQ